VVAIAPINGAEHLSRNRDRLLDADVAAKFLKRCCATRA
jgi:hypothetical protein